MRLIKKLNYVKFNTLIMQVCGLDFFKKRHFLISIKKTSLIKKLNQVKFNTLTMQVCGLVKKKAPYNQSQKIGSSFLEYVL